MPSLQNLSSSRMCCVRTELGGSGTARRSSTLLLIGLSLFIADVPSESAGLCVSQETMRWGVRVCSLVPLVPSVLHNSNVWEISRRRKLKNCTE